MSEKAVLPPAKLDGTSKLAVELGPLAAFFVGFFGHKTLGPMVDGALGTTLFAPAGHELFLAVLFSLPAFAIAFAYSVWRTRRVAPMLLISGVLVMVLGALTFIFQSKTFVYMKPTLIYAATAGVLGGGLLVGRLFLRAIFDGALQMEDAAWRTLTWRFVGFNVAAAITNEVLWRTLTAGCVADAVCAGDKTWTLIKLFGFTGAYFVFVLAHTPFFMRHMKETPKAES
jgi:intracellular septation protein